jgi:DNA-binding response OmpR family regulator
MATILLIDREESERVTLQVALEAAGHHVLSAADGREGLRLMDDQEVDLILMDMVRPDRDSLDSATLASLYGPTSQNEMRP